MTFDSTKFSDSLINHSTDLTALIDGGLGDINTILSRYSGSTGMLSSSLKTMDLERSIYDKRITKFNDALTARKKVLFDQYLGYQNQLVDYGYQQQIVTAMYGSTSGSTVNISG